MREDEKYYRQDWMTDSQWECACLFADIVGGFHHIQCKIKPCGDGIETSVHSGWATFDFNYLTVAVVLAHDKAIRMEVCSSGPGMVKLLFHKRQREGSMSRRHPTIETAIAQIRSRFAG